MNAQGNVKIRVWDRDGLVFGCAEFNGVKVVASIEKEKIRQVLESMAQAQGASSGSFLDNIGDFVSKISRNTVLKKILGTVSDVVKNPVFKQAASFIPVAGPFIAKAADIAEKANLALEGAGSAARMYKRFQAGDPEAKKAVSAIVKSKSPAALKMKSMLLGASKAPANVLDNIMKMAPDMSFLVSSGQVMKMADLGAFDGSDNGEIMASAGAYLNMNPQDTALLRVLDIIKKKPGGLQKNLLGGAITVHERR